jgi:homoserine dehydrogenase
MIIIFINLIIKIISIKVIFNGSPDYFLKIMKNKNYEFDIQNQIWVVK